MPSMPLASRSSPPVWVMGVKQVTRRIALIQLLVTLAVAAVSLVFSDLQAVWSALIGGGVSVLVSIYFASKIFSIRIGSPAAKIAQAFYVGEVVKLLLTVILLSAAFLWLPVAPLPLLLAYSAALLAYWLALPFTFHASTASVRTP
ncbi:MAG: F0F1 ATP synthase assembly protein I [Candidatus Competibacteraceae bacterium]|nr:MAG: F0F1 ATP synthase assembly protein I [Candidatus Competibacteraceae bacterium]